MTREESNNIIERVWTEHLRRKDKIPEDLANKFSMWLRGRIKSAAQLMVTDSGAGGGDEAAGGQQEAS